MKRSASNLALCLMLAAPGRAAAGLASSGAKGGRTAPVPVSALLAIPRQGQAAPPRPGLAAPVAAGPTTLSAGRALQSALAEAARGQADPQPILERFWTSQAALSTTAPDGPSAPDASGPASSGLSANTSTPNPQRASAPATPKETAPPPSRWQRMKASAKRDFRTLFASARTLKRGLRLPVSRAAIKADARAAAQFFSEVRALGWKVIAGVVVYYLIRDTILYILIPYLVLRGVSG